MKNMQQRHLDVEALHRNEMTQEVEGVQPQNEAHAKPANKLDRTMSKDITSPKHDARKLHTSSMGTTSFDDRASN